MALAATHHLPGACQRILAFGADALSPLIRMQLPGQCSASLGQDQVELKKALSHPRGKFSLVFTAIGCSSHEA